MQRLRKSLLEEGDSQDIYLILQTKSLLEKGDTNLARIEANIKRCQRWERDWEKSANQHQKDLDKLISWLMKKILPSGAPLINRSVVRDTLREILDEIPAFHTLTVAGIPTTVQGNTDSGETSNTSSGPFLPEEGGGGGGGKPYRIVRLYFPLGLNGYYSMGEPRFLGPRVGPLRCSIPSSSSPD